MSPPPKEKRGVGTALRNAELLAAYSVLTLLQAPFRLVFWKIEQIKGRLQDRFDNERSET
jgi:hypothetical protein